MPIRKQCRIVVERSRIESKLRQSAAADIIDGTRNRHVSCPESTAFTEVVRPHP
jgi:hypothetical protein